MVVCLVSMASVLLGCGLESEKQRNKKESLMRTALKGSPECMCVLQTFVKLWCVCVCDSLRMLYYKQV